jgi:flagellar protein FlgJ
MSSIANLRPQAKVNPEVDPVRVTAKKNDKVMKAAEMYEQQFLREMLRAMRSTVQESELMPASQGEKIYREQMDNHYVEKWGERGGVGLADMIYSHIMERYFNGNKIYQRPAGPIPLNNKGTFKLHQAQPLPMAPAGQKGANLYLERLSTPNGQAAQDVVAPWSGSVAIEDTAGDSVQIRIEHNDGVVSRLRFDGTKSAEVKSLGSVSAGQKLGTLSPDASGVFWSIETKT